MPKHILLVDDERMQRFAIKFALSKRGFRCSEVANGDKAIEKVKSGVEFDACILDLHLKRSEKTGLETLRELRRIDTTLPILVFSGNADDEIASDATSAGATLCMPKGFMPNMPNDLGTIVEVLVLHR